VIRIHCDLAASGWTYPPEFDASNHDSDASRTTRLVDRLTELTSAVLDLFEDLALDLFEDLAVDVEVVIARLVRFNASVVSTRPLTHVDELLDDLYTIWSNGMTTGDAYIDEMLAKAFSRD